MQKETFDLSDALTGRKGELNKYTASVAECLANNCTVVEEKVLVLQNVWLTK